MCHYPIIIIRSGISHCPFTSVTGKKWLAWRSAVSGDGPQSVTAPTISDHRRRSVVTGQWSPVSDAALAMDQEPGPPRRLWAETAARASEQCYPRGGQLATLQPGQPADFSGPVQLCTAVRTGFVSDNAAGLANRTRNCALVYGHGPASVATCNTPPPGAARNTVVKFGPFCPIGMGAAGV